MKINDNLSPQLLIEIANQYGCAEVFKNKIKYGAKVDDAIQLLRQAVNDQYIETKENTS